MSMPAGEPWSRSKFSDGECVGRPDLDPGTLGSDRTLPGASAIIHLTWSDPLVNPPTSAEILSNLVLGLHQWLHDSGSRAVRTIRFESVDGDHFELGIEA